MIENKAIWNQSGPLPNARLAGMHTFHGADGPTPDSSREPQTASPLLNGRRRKLSTTIRLDSDVLAWLREPGPGYQSRINAILRREMLRSRKP